ncbi:MAG TPA: adenylate/guanylate cyclase domain-containing protein [Actinomycetota bacterium]|nr:adenylate/guanylate cyclase domain-containing protein [Actinomycetota bacterium]
MAACPSCGKNNVESAKYCASCGTALELAGVREERKVVTILFCDLVGFTARFDLADPEDVREALAAYHERVRREIERFGGTVEKFIGDAVAAVYGAPVAHEDDAERALLSALRIPLAIEELNESNPDAALAVRIGIETGEALVRVGPEGSRQGIAVGDVVNTASRLQSAAPTGGILVGEGTYRLTRELFDYEPLEPVEVKGKAARLPVWVAKRARSRFGADVIRAPSTPLVDRENELELLNRIFARTRRERSVQLVTLMGEPGVGKSRTLLEFFAFIDDQPELVVWRQGRCLPYGEGVTFWALAGIVKAEAGILASDGVEEAREKLEASVARLIEESDEREWVRTRLAPLIGLEVSLADGVDRAEAFSAWRRYLEAIATDYPLVMVIEDIHWAGDALLDFVEHVVDWSTGATILVLCTARPELFGRNPHWGGGKRNSSIVSLSPLTEEETERIVSALLPEGIPPEVSRGLVDRAGGNPLFAEEFARMLGERGTPLDETTLDSIEGVGSPENLQAIIAARLDALPAPHKALLQDASVVGKVFWPGALVDVGGSDAASVHEGLHELARKELVRASRDSSVKDEMEYSFSHALVRDVAYGQIPRKARARKHVAVARWTERLAGERVADHAELIARHYGRALELGRSGGTTDDVRGLEESAQRYWMIAGERAMAFDVSDAERCFDTALSLLPEAHPDRPRALARKAEASFDAGRYEEAERTFEEAVESFGEQGDPVGQGASLEWLAVVLWERGDGEGSRVRLAEAVEILEAQTPGPELANCYSSIASERLVSCRFAEAVEWSERALAVAGSVGAEWMTPRALSYRGMARVQLGDLEGLDDLERAIAEAERLSLSRQHAQGLLILAEVLWATEGPAKALETCDAGIRVAERRGVFDQAIGCRTLSLGPLFDLGRWSELLSVAEEVGKWSLEEGADYSTASAEPWTAQVLLWRGDVGSAAALTSETIARAREIRDPQVLVPAVAAAGLVAAREGRIDEAASLVEELDRSEAPIDWYREQFLADLVRICTMSGRVDLARRLLDRSNVFTLRHRLSMLTARAVLEEASEDHERALTEYEEAVRSWSEFGHVLETGMALLGAGRCLARLGRPESVDRLGRAREVFVGLDAVLLVGDADEFLVL